MRFLWKRRQQERDNIEKRYDMDEAISTISARLRCLEVLATDLVAELPPTKRNRLLQHFGEAVRELQAFPTPRSVPPGKEQEYHDELRRAVEVLIENSEPKLRRP